MKAVLIILCLWLAVVPPVVAQGSSRYSPYGNSEMYRNGWIDFNKNGEMDPYEDPALDIDIRIEDLQILDRNMNWTVEPDWFKLMIGSSSVDDRLEGRFEIGPADRLSYPYDANSLTR